MLIPCSTRHASPEIKTDNDQERKERFMKNQPIIIQILLIAISITEFHTLHGMQALKRKQEQIEGSKNVGISVAISANGSPLIQLKLTPKDEQEDGSTCGLRCLMIAKALDQLAEKDSDINAETMHIALSTLNYDAKTREFLRNGTPDLESTDFFKYKDLWPTKFFLLSRNIDGSIGPLPKKEDFSDEAFQELIEQIPTTIPNAFIDLFTNRTNKTPIHFICTAQRTEYDFRKTYERLKGIISEIEKAILENKNKIAESDLKPVNEELAKAQEALKNINVETSEKNYTTEKDSATLQQATIDLTNKFYEGIGSTRSYEKPKNQSKIIRSGKSHWILISAILYKGQNTLWFIDPRNNDFAIGLWNVREIMDSIITEFLIKQKIHLGVPSNILTSSSTSPKK